MNKRAVISALLILALAAAIVLGLLFNSRRQEANKLRQQNIDLTQQKSNLQKAAASLSGKLNDDDATIKQLSASGSFVNGAACQSQQLTFALENDNQHNPGGAAGTIGQLFSYQNISKSTCTLNGYPGFLALDSKGYVVPDGPIQTGAMGLSPKTITLAPDAKAYFVVSWNHTMPATNQRCIKPSLLESTPPGALTPLVLSTSDIDQICSLNISISALGNLSDF